MTLRRTAYAIGASTILWLTVAGATADVPGSEYRSQEFGFGVQPPHGWMVYGESSPQIQAFFAAAHGATTPSGDEAGRGLVVIFSEFPLGASVPFNTNVTLSIYPLRGKALPDVLLRQAAAALLGDLAPEQSCSTPQEIRLTMTWLQSNCHYEQVTEHRHASIHARLAMAVDPLHRQYILLTASALKTEFARYETLFHQALASFRWTNREAIPSG